MWKRSIWLYVFIVVLVMIVVKRNVVNIKILDHFHDGARAVHAAYDEGKLPTNLQYLDTIDYYRKLLDITTQWDFVHSMLGYCFYKIGKLNDAMGYYKTAIEKTPDFMGLYYNLSLIYFEKKQWSDVVEVAAKGLELQDEKSFYYYNVVADKKHSEGDYYNVPADKEYSESDEEKKWMAKQVLRLKLGHTQMYKMLILAFDHLNEYEKLFLLSSKLVQINSQPLDWYLYYAGKAAYRINKNEEAFVLLQACLKENPKMKEAYQLLGAILKAKGRDDVASMYIRRAEDLPSLSEKNFFDPINADLFMYVPVNEINR